MRSISVVICLGMGLIARVDGSSDHKPLRPDGEALKTGTESELKQLDASANEIFDSSDSLSEQLTKEAVAKILHGFREKHDINLKETPPPAAVVERCKSILDTTEKQPKFFQSTSDSHEVHAAYFPINIDNKDHVVSISVIVVKGTAFSDFDFLGMGSSTDFSFIPPENPVKPEIWKADQVEQLNEANSETITPSYIKNWLAAHERVIAVLWFDYSSANNKAQVIFATPPSASSATGGA